MSKKKFRDFDFFVLNPNNSSNEVTESISDNDEDPTVAASVILLQVDNDNPNFPEIDVNIRIFRGTPAEGDEIFFSSLEVGPTGTVGDKILIPVAHVDVVEEDTDNALYTLTVDVDVEGIRPVQQVTLTGPITFTAVRITDTSSSSSSSS
jgi:hypothetical protein